MLSKSVLSIPFKGGVDTKTAEKLAPQGSFLDLVNIVRTKTGAHNKRPGFSAISTKVFGTDVPISYGSRLSTFINELLLIDNKNLFSYSATNNAWANRGQVVAAEVASTPIIRNSGKQAMPDSCSYRGCTATVWEDSTGGVLMSILTDDTQTPLLYNYTVSQTGSRPRIVGVNGNFVVTYYAAGAIKAGYVSLVAPSILTLTGNVQTGALDAPYDLAAMGDVAVCVFNTSAGLKVLYVTKAGQAGSPGSNGYPAPITLTDKGTSCVSLVCDATNSLIYLMYHDPAGSNANAVRGWVYTGDLNTSAGVTIETIAGVSNITGTLTSSGGVRIFYEISDASVNKYRVNQAVITYFAPVLVSGGANPLLRSVGLATKAFSVGDDDFVTVAHESALQSTYFTVKQDGFVIARMQAGLGGGLTRDAAGTLKSGLPRVSVDDSGNYVFPVQVRNRLTTEGDATTQAGFVGLNKQSLTFRSPEFNSDTLGSNYTIAGGVALAYDAVSTVELGFNLFPEDLTATTSGSGGSLTAGDYRIAAIYEWVDGQGQLHRSATSIPITAAASNNGTISVTVPTLRITAKAAGTRAAPRIVLYRTISGQTAVFYRDVEVINDPTVDTTVVVLSQGDAGLQTHEILYTTGGVLNNDPPPACTVVHKHKNRLWFAGLEDANSIGYTKETQVGEGIAFSNGFLKRVDPRGGPVRTLATLDEKLIIGKDTALFALSGDGPVDTGLQDDFTTPVLISSDIGAPNQRSIVVTPMGIMFQSNRGIYLLDRSLATSYIGAEVERFNGELITSATISESNTEVRFTTEASSCLVYNYLYKTWSTFSNYAAQDAVNFLGSYAHLTSAGVVNVENISRYNDNGQKYSMRIETTWLQLGNVQGFQRIYRWSLLGDFLSHCYAKVSVGYNYENTYNETVYFNTGTGLGTDTFGADAHFGDAIVTGGSGSSVFQFRSKPRQQKCESIKLLIEDLDTVTPSGGGSFSLVSLAMEIASKQGLMKMGNNKTRGG